MDDTRHPFLSEIENSGFTGWNFKKPLHYIFQSTVLKRKLHQPILYSYELESYWNHSLNRKVKGSVAEKVESGTVLDISFFLHVEVLIFLCARYILCKIQMIF